MKRGGFFTCFFHKPGQSGLLFARELFALPALRLERSIAFPPVGISPAKRCSAYAERDMAGKGMGGARPGAGRKPDAVTVRTRMMANRMIADGGAAPLEVMIRTMRALWLRATDKKGEVIDMDQAIDACAIAEKAAPYIHPRLAATTDGKGNILPAIFTIKIDGKDGS